MRYLTVLTIFLWSFTLSAKLLDKIMAVVDDEIITLSMVNRIQSNIEARKNISPLIYRVKNYTNKAVADHFINGIIIRQHLKEVGYVVSDQQVESQIEATEKRLGLNRASLLTFLKGNNLTFEEYFEVIRQTIEYNIFHSRVISPLVSISEQEIKNYYYEKNTKGRSVSFRYDLVDFYIPANLITRSQAKDLRKVLKQYRSTGILPEDFKAIDSNAIDDVRDDGLQANIKTALANISEGSFSRVTKIGDDYHVFFVKKKNLVESTDFLSKKREIKNNLIAQKTSQVHRVWIRRQLNNHFVRYFFK